MIRMFLVLLACFCAAVPALAASVYDKELPYKVRFGQAADVVLLLSKGADPNQLDEGGMPLVAVAASRTDGQAVPILRALVAAKANINEGGVSKLYPVIMAARNGDTGLMRFLLNEASADYNVQDPNGAYARDIAEHNGYTDIVAMIDAIHDERSKIIDEMYSPERRNALFHELLFSSCAYNYSHYYFSTKQDDISPETKQETLGRYKGSMANTMQELERTFMIDQASLVTVATESSKRVFNQLEKLISNRNRRKHGVGTEDDLKKRCTAIAEAVFKERIHFAEPAAP